MAKVKDGSNLPFWAAVAFVSRCARRCAERYLEDAAEPRASRVAVEEAILLAEYRAACGGNLEEFEGFVEIDSRFFDNYDIEALLLALMAYRDAALNTYSDLNDSVSRKNLAATELALLAMWAAFPLFGNEDSGRIEPVRALEVLSEGDSSLVPYAEAELFLLGRLAEEEGWTDESAVAAHLFQWSASSE